MLPKKTSPQVVKCQTSEALTENGKVEFTLYTNICTIILPTVLNLTYEMKIIRLPMHNPSIVFHVIAYAKYLLMRLQDRQGIAKSIITITLMAIIGIKM